MDALLHTANIIYLVSYTMRDILWLRIFTVAAATSLLVYFYSMPEPLLTPVYWNVVFVGLNLVWIGKLLYERRPVKLTDDEQQLCELVFRLISPREMITLLKLGTWETAAPDDCIVKAGEPMDDLMLIQSGQACLLVNGTKFQVFDPGQFIGSISFVTDEASPADLVALKPTRYMRWKKSSLNKYMAKNPDLQAAIQATLSADLSKKLKASWIRS